MIKAALAILLIVALAGCSSSGAGNSSAPTKTASATTPGSVTDVELQAVGRSALGATLSDQRIKQLADAVCSTYATDGVGSAESAEISVEMAPDVQLPTDDPDVSKRVNRFVQAAVLHGCPDYWDPDEYYDPTPSPTG